MNIRISNKKNKVNKNLKILKDSLPNEIISVIENSRFRYKEGLYRILGFLLYRSAYGYSMRVSQRTIAAYLSISRTYVCEIIRDLRKAKLLFMTYGTYKRNGYYCHQASTYTISPLLRNADANFQSKLCYLYPFLAKVSFTFFNVLGNLQKAVSDKLSQIKSTLYNISPYFIKSSYNKDKETYQKRDENISFYSDTSPPLEKNLLKPENVAESLVSVARQCVPNFVRERFSGYRQKNGIDNPYKGDDPVDIKNLFSTIGNKEELATLLRITERKRPERYEQY